MAKSRMQENGINEFVIFIARKVHDLSAWSSWRPNERHVHHRNAKDIPSKYQRVLESIDDSGHSRRADALRDQIGFGIDDPLEIDIGHRGISPVPNDPPYVFSIFAHGASRKSTLRNQVSDKTRQKG